MQTGNSELKKKTIKTMKSKKVFRDEITARLSISTVQRAFPRRRSRKSSTCRRLRTISIRYRQNKANKVPRSSKIVVFYEKNMYKQSVHMIECLEIMIKINVI